ncbi:hypothetical protein M5K25_017897 [Dendrobium thyrsiflorum]|uniref:Protein kinase domain-containing protein n=1 Tax=Dendrobium thyrsiflorum TaxID=117978 RepID=A0ABD0UGT1_DENTH
MYMWDGKKCKNRDPVLTRLPGIKHVTSACVGETHLLAVCALYHPAYLPALESSHQASILKDNHDIDDLDEELLFSDIQPDISEPFMQNKYEVCKPVPSLKSLCEKVVAEFLVEPRNAIQLLEIADSLEAEDLRKYCEDLVIRNFDYLFTVSAAAIGSASLEILARLENMLDAISSEPWSYCLLPRSTVAFPVVIYSEEDGDNEFLEIFVLLPILENHSIDCSSGADIVNSKWWRGGKLSKAILQTATIPSALAKKADRQGKMGFASILKSRQVAWRAAVELSKSASQLALQIRYLDAHKRWKEFTRPEQIPNDNKGSETNIMIFRNPSISDKKIWENKILYALKFRDQKHLPSRITKTVLESEKYQDGNEKLWYVVKCKACEDYCHLYCSVPSVAKQEEDTEFILKKEIDMFELQWYGFCMFRALASLHKQGVVHRDVKANSKLSFQMQAGVDDR